MTQQEYVLLTKIDKDVGILMSHVVGNGTPGLVKRVSKLEEEHGEVQGAIGLAKWGIPVAMSFTGIVAGIIVKLL